jgi:tripartite-type tricarboxylate transporter receptor subunit TctC
MRLRVSVPLLWLCAALVLSAAPALVFAQSGLIRIIVGTAPGGAIDPYARLIAEHMTKTLGQTIIIENKPGAGGNLAAQFMAEAPADGSLIWLGTQAFTEINPNAYSNQRWTIDSFLPIIRGVEAPLVFVAHPSVPANTLPEFVDWAKQNRGKLSYASYQPGTPSHFLGYQLNEKFDLDLTHVPYRGSGLQATALIAGHSLFGFAQMNSSMPQVQTGKLKGAGNHQRNAPPFIAGRAELCRTRPSGVHRASVVRTAGESRHAARNR